MEKEYIATYLVKQTIKVVAQDIELVGEKCKNTLLNTYGKDGFVLHSIKVVEEKEIA